MNGPARDKIGDYEILEAIGQGSRGRVFKAKCVATNNPRIAKDQVVSLKVLHLPGQDARDADRFKEQAEVLCHLAHPNIIKYLDVFVWRPGEWDEVRCLVTELLEGETLDDRIKKCPQGLEWAEVKVYFQQATAALAFARASGVLHRDIKPSNIFLTKDGAVKVFDFDIVRKDEDGQQSTAAWKGTFDYMAPDFLTVQHFRGDEQSDIFSLGICFYEALTGKLPFEPLTKGAHVAYLNRWFSGEKPPEPSFRPAIFRVLTNARRFVEKCIHPQREQRFATFAQVEEELGRIHYRRIKHDEKEEYEIQSVLGRGGFGEVFFARRLRDGMKVAVKHLFAQKQSERFLREAKMLQRCEHPHICRYIDFFVIKSTTEEQYYLVLEYLEGMPAAALRYRIKKEGQLPVDEAVPLFINYLRALQFLHEGKKPIIHRDIKPTNLYAPRGRPDQARIFDLGVARDVTGTVTYGGVPGTLDYMAPEFAKPGADRGSAQSDLYALGLCLYEAVCGKPAFEKLPTELNTAWTEFQRRASTRRDLNFDAPVFKENPRLAAAIRKATAPDPEDRFASAREMIRDLELVIGISSADAEAATMVTSATAPSVKELPSLESQVDEATPTPTPSPAPSPNKVRIEPPPKPRERKKAPAPAPARAPEPPEPHEHDAPTMGTRVDGVNHEGLRWAARQRAIKKALIGSCILMVAAGIAFVGIRIVTGLPVKRAQSDAESIVADLKAPEASAAYLEKVKAGAAKLREYSDRYPKYKATWREEVSTVEGYARRVPDKFKEDFALAAVNKKSDDVARLLNEWQQVGGDLALMGLSSEDYEERQDYMTRMSNKVQFDQAVAEVKSNIPEKIADDASLKQAEAAAMGYRTIAGKAWEGISPDERKKQFDQVLAAITTAANAYLSGLTAAVSDKVGRGENVDSERAALAGLPDQAPALTALVRPAYDDAMKDVDQARANTEGTREAKQILAAIASVKTVGELDPALLQYAAWTKNHKGPLADELSRSIADAFTAKYRDFVMEEYRQARADYDALRITEGSDRQKNLQVLLTLVPEKFGRQDLAKMDVELTALQKDAAARVEKADVQKKQLLQDQQKKDAQAVAARKERDRQEAIAEGERRLTELEKKADATDTHQLRDAVKYLAEFDTNLLQVASVRKAWDSAAATYGKLIDTAIVQKDPLEKRAERVDDLFRIVNGQGADLVLGPGIAAMKTKLDTQKAKFILRLANQSQQILTVSSGEILRKTVIAPGQRLDISLAARSDNAGAPFVIEGGEGYKPRTKIVGLVSGGGLELALNALEPAEVEKIPVKTAETEANETGVFQISVSPRTAIVSVDGAVVDQGNLTVSSEDNHKLHVEAPGYQTYEQYYRVGTGKTKTIDILLTKEKKKSGFF